MKLVLARWICQAIVVTIARLAVAQSGFNCDLNNPFSSPETGGGVPSITYGAASGQSGFWNAISTGGLPTENLRGLDGNLTSVTLTGPMGGSGGGWNVPGLNADYRALMADVTSVNPTKSYTLSGLANGTYQVYSYAVRPNGGVTSTAVTVPQAIGQTTRFATGPLPMNTFAEGVTHTLHTANVVSGELTIRLDMGQQQSYFNGFQIVAVPEPASLLFLASGSVLLVRLRKKK